MKPYRVHGAVRIYHGDCLRVVPTLGPCDAVVTDPPYGLGFMGKDWDHGVPGVQFWREVYRVLKPGGHLLAFGGTRTHHRLVCAIEDAGFEIRDEIQWLYGSGFPKSLDIGKAIDKAAGAERELRVNEQWAKRYPNGPGGNLSGDGRSEHYGQAKRIFGNPLMTSDPVTAEAKQWDGWGTALKPACEPICVARKPLEGTVAANVLRHGTGGINVDWCRVGTERRHHIQRRNDPELDGHVYGRGINGSRSLGETTKGRWPANVLLTHAEGCVCTGTRRVRAGVWGGKQNTQPGSGRTLRSSWNGTPSTDHGVADADGLETVEAWQCVAGCPGAQLGDAARFFYTAKASRSERRENNNHPTVKPLALMRYLCRLVTPPGGTVLDPFCGSGTTLIAAQQLGLAAVGIDIEERHCHIAAARVASEPIIEPDEVESALPTERQLSLWEATG